MRRIPPSRTPTADGPVAKSRVAILLLAGSLLPLLALELAPSRPAADLPLTVSALGGAVAATGLTVALYLRSLGRVALDLRLRRAMRRGELTLFFQPKASMADGRLVGAEALVRWIDPKRGTRHPDEWIGCVERGRCARRFNLHVLDLAIGQICAWQRQGRSLAVSVNLSPRALAQPGLPSEVAQLLAKWDVDARLLEIEITELAVAESGSDTLLEGMARLRALGVSLSIDDFGVGHSSLDRLAELPVAALKIDRSFVMRMGDGDERSESIVRAAIDLAHDLAITPVAEGVESESVWHRLRALGCTRAQGYLLSKPLPPEELTRAAGPHGRLTARLLALAPSESHRQGAARRATAGRRGHDRPLSVVPRELASR